MSITIKLRRTSNQIEEVSTVPEQGEPVYSLNDNVLVVGNGNDSVSSLPRAYFFTKNISTNKFFKGGGPDNYPVFKEISEDDIPNLSVNKLTGVLEVTKGGTGFNSTVPGGVLYGGNNNTIFMSSGALDQGYVLVSGNDNTLSWVNPSTNLTVDKAYKDGNGNFINNTYAAWRTLQNIGSNIRPVYFDANGHPKVINYSIQSHVPANAKFTDTTYTGIDGISISGTVISNSGVRSVATGTEDGAISVNINGTTEDVAVRGLSGASTVNDLTFKGDGTGVSPNSNFNLTQPRIISYNSIGAAPLDHTHSGTQITPVTAFYQNTGYGGGVIATCYFNSFVIINVSNQMIYFDVNEWDYQPSLIPNDYRWYSQSEWKFYRMYVATPLEEEFRPKKPKFNSLYISNPAQQLNTTGDYILCIDIDGNLYIGGHPNSSNSFPSSYQRDPTIPYYLYGTLTYSLD